MDFKINDVIIHEYRNEHGVTYMADFYLGDKVRKLLADNKRLMERIQDFLDYFDPKGGVSDVPLGPFERAKELLQALTKEEE